MDPARLDDPLDSWRASPLGDRGLMVVDVRTPLERGADQAIVIGTDLSGTAPDVDPAPFDLLLTAAYDAPAPWVSVGDPARAAARLRTRVGANPQAAALLCATLRTGERLETDDALMLESLAYSTLLGGDEFARWRSARPAVPAPVRAQPLRLARDADTLTITLADPASRNAMSAVMRDALYEALANALGDPTGPHVLLTGAGRCFSTGGDIGEFGSATDLAAAHAIRTARSCARLALALGGRLEARLHGACIGSGIEIPAAAGRRVASQGAWFQLPEVAMGLIPGAGGTVTLSRAIGRHRTAWLALSGLRLPATQALAWGLVHEIVE